MNYQEPNLSNVPKSPALPEESSSPQSEAAADPRFVMPSISPFPMNRTVISTATIDSQSSQPQLRQQTQQRQPIIPLPFLSANPQLAQSANINHMNMNRSTNQRNIVRGPMCHNAQQQTQQVQQHRQAHHPSQPGYHPSLYNGMNHQQITHQNRFNNNELCVTNTAQQQHQLQQQQHHQQQQQQQQALRHGSQAQVQQSAQSAAARMSNMGTMNTMNGNNMRLHQLTQNQTRNQPQNAANNIANVNHIQNKYNTTIINLNGSLNGNLNGLMDSVVQMNGEVDNQCVVPYPSNGQHHGAQNNINMIRARARSNAAVPMSASLTKRGSIMAGKYKILSVLADGTFSRTVCAQDIKTLRLVAIKIMKDKCQYVGVQEAKRLAFFNSKDAEDLCHVVRFVETIHYQTRFCLVLEILGISLFKYLQINQFATLNVVRKVAIQLMISMQFVHSFNQIHADLKPENVLLVKESTTQRKAIRSSKNCKIKVIDFGNSISLAESEAYFDKFEIQSLYYRAPEVVLGCRFGCAIDIWSCGCILMELVLGAPLFATHNKSALCHKIHSVLGLFCKDAVLSSFAHGKKSSIVFDFGAGSTRCTPVYDGYVINEGCKYTKCGGLYFDELLMEKLFPTKPCPPMKQSTGFLKLSMMSELRESVFRIRNTRFDVPNLGFPYKYNDSYVASHNTQFDAPFAMNPLVKQEENAVGFMENNSTTIIKIEKQSSPVIKLEDVEMNKMDKKKECVYTLPDGQKIACGDWKYCVPELLFVDYDEGFRYDFEDEWIDQMVALNGQNTKMNLNKYNDRNYYQNTTQIWNDTAHKTFKFKGLTSMMLESLNGCDIDIRPLCARNVIISGGHSRYKGFVERLAKELSCAMPYSWTCFFGCFLVEMYCVI